MEQDKKLTKIAIVGHHGLSSVAAQQLMKNGIDPEIVVFDDRDLEDHMIGSRAQEHYDFQIDGVKYRRIPERRMSKSAQSLLGVASMFGALPKLPEANRMDDLALVSEYILIQAKKSNLSANQRAGVEWRFRRIFETVE